MREAGYSLAELLIAMTLLAILALLAGPSLGDVLVRHTIREARDTFVTRHASARSLAIRHGTIAELHVDAAGDRYWVAVDTSASGSGTKVTVGPVVDMSASGVDVETTRSLLCFDPRGLASELGSCPPGDATVTFQRDGRADTVTTTSLGLILR